MKNIYLLIGRSGSGKSTVADILEKKYGWKVLQSYTTRQPRFDGETGHTFVSKEEFDKLEDKCAYTLFAGNEYCATSQQVDESDVYVIDPAGVEYFMQKYTGHKHPICAIINISEEEARRRMSMRKGASEEETERRIENDRFAFGEELEKIIANEDLDVELFSGTIWNPETIAECIYEDGLEYEE